MPTENEKKYVLDQNCEFDFVVFSDYPKEIISIEQAYADDFLNNHSVRIRNWNGKKIFTFKKWVGQRLIEIETEIDDRDYYDLWNVFKAKLKKTRYVIGFPEGVWEIDFFKNTENGNYFSVAEHEMEENCLTPNKIPDIIIKNMIYDVPLGSRTITSQVLWDEEQARYLLRKIRMKELQ